MAPRYAVYFAPTPGGVLHELGAAWLAADGPRPDGMTAERLAHLTAAPRHYGFHGTLKAPFRLAEGFGERDLVDAACAFAAATAGFMLPGLTIAALSDFIALVPRAPSAALGEMANACVAYFDCFRAPLTEAELARRRPDKLSPAQRGLLARWGYPYVFEEFRFHMTLTGPLTADEKACLLPFLDGYFASALAFPVEFDAITLFRQRSAGTPFEFLSRFELSRPMTIAV